MTDLKINELPLPTTHLVCCVCRQVLSKPVRRFVGRELNVAEQEPIVPVGTLALSNDVFDDEEAFYGLLKNEVVIGLSDLIDVSPYGNRTGCCGPSGDSPNLQCRKGHMIGTEVGDCYQPHFVHLPLAWVDFVEE